MGLLFAGIILLLDLVAGSRNVCKLIKWHTDFVLISMCMTYFLAKSNVKLLTEKGGLAFYHHFLYQGSFYPMMPRIEEIFI